MVIVIVVIGKVAVDVPGQNPPSDGQEEIEAIEKNVESGGDRDHERDLTEEEEEEEEEAEEEKDRDERRQLPLLRPVRRPRPPQRNQRPRPLLPPQLPRNQLLERVTERMNNFSRTLSLIIANPSGVRI